MTPFCALCLRADTGPFEREPLGRNDALVLVCLRCRGEDPRSGGYDFNGGRESGKPPEFVYHMGGRTGPKRNK